MASTEKWEKVGGKTKKANSKDKLSKSEKQALFQSMTKIEDLPLSKTQSPMFDTTNDGSRNGTALSKPAAKASKKKPKKPEVAKIPIFKTIEEAMKSEDLKSFDEKVKELQERFPSNQLLWTKELASYLNLNLLCTEALTAENTRKEANFPMSKATKSFSDAMTRSFGKKLRAAIVPLLYKFCLNCMVECIARDQSALGYQLCLQVLAQNRQQLCLEELSEEKIVSEILGYQNSPKKCFAFAWAIAQTGAKDTKAAYQVWLRIMLPTLNVKCLSSYSMDMIETLLNDQKSVGDLKCKADQFHQICQWSYGTSVNITKAQLNIKKRMDKLYSFFEKAMLRFEVSRQEYFIYFLELDDKQISNEPEEISDKLVELAVQCLLQDNYCVTYWRDNYLQNIYKTRLIIDYFITHPDQATKANSKKVFNETIRSLRNTNEDLVARSHSLASNSDFHQIRKFCEACAEDHKQHDSSSVGWLWTIVVLLVAISVGVVVMDVKVDHGGVWEGCRTEVFLRESGAIQLYRHVELKVNLLADEVIIWYRHKFPYYSEQLREVLVPYVDTLAEFYAKGSQQLYEWYEPLHVQLEPYWKEYVQEPCYEFFKICAGYTLEVTNFLLSLFTRFCKYLLQLIKKGHAQLNIMLADDFDWMKFREEIVAELTKFCQQLPGQIEQIYQDVLKKLRD